MTFSAAESPLFVLRRRLVLQKGVKRSLVVVRAQHFLAATTVDAMFDARLASLLLLLSPEIFCQ